MSNYCVCCNKEIPEGRMVCPECEANDTMVVECRNCGAKYSVKVLEGNVNVRCCTCCGEFLDQTTVQRIHSTRLGVR